MMLKILGLLLSCNSSNNPTISEKIYCDSLSINKTDSANDVYELNGTPFTGRCSFREFRGNWTYKDGKRHGTQTRWYWNRQKRSVLLIDRLSQ